MDKRVASHGLLGTGLRQRPSAPPDRDGHGRMLGKVLDLLTVIDGSGSEFDTGELVTQLQ